MAVKAVGIIECDACHQEQELTKTAERSHFSPDLIIRADLLEQAAIAIGYVRVDDKLICPDCQEWVETDDTRSHIQA